MPAPELTDGVVLLRQWQASDADWYAATVRDPLIQRYTSEPPTLTADQVRVAIAELPGQADAVGLVICDARTGQRLGDIALRYDAKTGEVSYWVAAGARGRGVATRALRLLSDWAFAALELSEIGRGPTWTMRPPAWWRNAPGIDASPTTTSSARSRGRSGTPSATSGPLQTRPDDLLSEGAPSEGAKTPRCFPAGSA